MNPWFLFAYGDGLSLMRAFIANFNWWVSHCMLNWWVSQLSFKLVSKPLHFKLVSKPPVPYACVGIYILRDVFYEAYYTFLLPYMRNVYITCLLFFF